MQTVKNFSQVIAAICLTAAFPVISAPPALKTEGTVIYLKDNLDESENLGWCIDTVGRGFAEQLHAHSCKPRGGDVQFGYNTATQQIYSVEFPGKCMTLVNEKHTSVPFGLLDCDNSIASQRFLFDDVSSEIRLTTDTSICVIVGESSRSAGPFMSRDLTLADCSAVDEKFRQWQYQR